MVLVEAGQPLRRGAFVEIMLRHKTTVTRQLDGLERKGLVQRKPDPRDGRAMLIAPTAKGTRQIKKLLPPFQQLRDSLKQGLAEQECKPA